MLSIRVEGVPEATNFLRDIVIKTPNQANFMLDRLATETRGRMRENAPYGTWRHGGQHLKDSIQASKPSSFTRVIEPTATNIKGEPFGKWVELGSGPGYIPNIEGIRAYYGVDKKVAWAIALKIKETGTPADRFVQRTEAWLVASIDRYAFDFLNKLVTN